MDGAKDTRPTYEEYDKYIYLIELMKHYNYDEKALYDKFPFKIKDVEFCGQQGFVSYRRQIGEDAGEILDWISRTGRNFHKFFSLPSDSGSANSDNLFYDYDLVIKDRISKITASSFAMLSSGLVSDQEAKALVKWMSDDDFCAEYDTIASTFN